MKTTIIIPTSSIPSHPSTEILDETISTIRTHLPDSEIILMFDGLRKEHQDRRRTYNEYIRRALFKANTEYGNVYPVIFKEHHHQTGMTKAILEDIRTETILYIEQDTPLTPDWEIPFDNLEKIIKDGDSNLIRFHFESIIPKEHNHMMLSTEKFRDVTLMKTVQWSQRPHLSSLAFYRRILNDYFSENSKSFIEDKMHSVLHSAFIDDGELGWHQFKTHIYYPKGSIKRSYHTDGRNGEAKYDDTQVF